MTIEPSSIDQNDSNGPGARGLVLMVDDDSASLLMAEGPLLDAGYDVVQASNGLEAIEQFNLHLPDLVVMDAVMPEMDGFDAIAQIRQTSHGQHVPILMITGLDDLASIDRAYDEGATDFLTKPINFFLLPHRVQYMLRSKNTADELRASQKQVHDLAYHDLVTGLPNRVWLKDNLTQALKIADRRESQFALLFLDLDHFKQVNDTLGHDAGDELLVQVSKRLSAVLRESDTIGRLNVDHHVETESQDAVARIGGDEFVIILDEIESPTVVAKVAERIAKSIGMPYELLNREVSVTTTIGISVFPTDGRDSETLMKHADIAMYHAKENGRNGFQFYSRSIHEQALHRFSLENELERAIEENKLKLMFLPKADIKTGRIVGVEALARWHHPEKGEISPAEFIPIAEETGLIIQFGQWVLKEAARQVKIWVDNGVGEYTVSVNCSPVQFTRGNMIGDIESALREQGVDSNLLEIELTEKLFLNNIENGVRLVEQLKSLGVHTAIDDFCTDVSSLTYLKRLCVDKLKIDRMFVKDIVQDKGDEAIVSALITLAHNLDLSVVAEGVESCEQFDILKKLNCDQVQGYYLSKPLTSDEFERLVAESSGITKLAS